MSAVDLSDPLAPVEVGTLAFPAQAEGIAISGNHAFVADREGGLRVIDISRPAAPVAVTVLDLGNLVFDVEVSGTYAYVTSHGYWCDDEYCGDTSGALHVIDVFDPAAPRVVATLSRQRAPENVFVYGRHVYFIERWVTFSDMRDRLIVADASNPAAPIDVAQYFPVWDPTGMAAAGPYLFVPENTSVTVLQVYKP